MHQRHILELGQAKYTSCNGIYQTPGTMKNLVFAQSVMGSKYLALRGSTTFRTFFSKIEFFKKFLPPCNYPSWNKTNTINISVCRCLGNTASFIKGVQRYPHYKHHWVKIKTFGGSKLFFADTAYMDLGDKPQTCGFLSNWLCRKIKMWKNGVFCFAKNKYVGYCAKRK